MRYIIFFFPFLCLGQIAFPTAEGFGKNTTGGRGGTILHVTNLNDSGAGSLRDALDKNFARTIVFDVGGDILITGNQLGIYASQGEGNLTIAGETAPFPGITVKGDNIANTSFGGLFDISASNIIIRYISVRNNNNNATDNDAIRIRNDAGVSNIILDHVSLSNGSDEIFSITGLTNGTVQSSMFTDSDTAYNFLFATNNFNFSFINNYNSHSDQRNVLVGFGTNGETSEFINNVFYGYSEGMYVVYGNNTDVIGNVYKAFPASPPNAVSIAWSGNGFNNPSGVVTDGSFYFADNFLINPQGQALYNGNVGIYNSSNRVITNSLITSFETTQTQIENSVFNKNIGNSLHQDSMDTQAIADYAAGTGGYSSLVVPNKTLATRPGSDDSDNDDMLDVAEIAIWGNITATNAPNGFTASTNYTGLSSYTNIEKTHFYLAVDLTVSSGGTTIGVTPQSGKKTNDAFYFGN